MVQIFQRGSKYFEIFGPGGSYISGVQIFRDSTFGNYHVRARKYKLAHISGTVRPTKMKLSPYCCARCGLYHESVVVYRALWPSAKTCRNEKI